MKWWVSTREISDINRARSAGHREMPIVNDEIPADAHAAFIVCREPAAVELDMSIVNT